MHQLAQSEELLSHLVLLELLAPKSENYLQEFLYLVFVGLCQNLRELTLGAVLREKLEQR